MMSYDGPIRPLPILTRNGELPTGRALDTLRRAKLATGYPGLVEPCKALQGSPEPILAVGVEPWWLTAYAYVPHLFDVGRLTEALRAILINPDDPRIGQPVDLLSKWAGVEVREVQDERFEAGDSND